ncbi:hypothetical protein RND71_025939 [Anisodus tanguticus]|uniref:UBP-type domain-containing protein n=1 Tax=Anisodus tanguticus TaxID=243964 RepID=A0AAE1RLE6_9SOLA|nr:hypothetical protein RND71_025939 [Anisodus tanguticus]
MTKKREIEDSIVDEEAGGKRQKIVEQPFDVRRDCPFLDTVNRQIDFEKKCSVSSINFNVYACLICGKYYQGKGKNTHAHKHSHEAGHHVYIIVQTEKVYCLPDGYDVKHSPCSESKVGLNNIKEKTDFVNVTIQSLMRVTPREPTFFFLQAVMESSEKCFLKDVQSDPAEFMSWILKTLHADLRGSKKGNTIIQQSFQGEMEVVKEIHSGNEADNSIMESSRMPFLILELDLPPAPLFKDVMEQNIIPQVSVRTGMFMHELEIGNLTDGLVIKMQT